MSALRPALIVIGILVLLAGIVFALQGANVIGGSVLMSGNSTYIYVGAIVALLGLGIAAVGLRLKKASTSPETAPPMQSNSQ